MLQVHIEWRLGPAVRMAAGGEVGQQLCVPARAVAGLPGPACHPGAPQEQHLCQDDQTVIKD